MSLANVESALRAAAVEALTTELDIDEENIAGENLNFDRDNVSYPWAEFFYIPGQTEPHTMGANGLNQVVGVLQISIHYEKGSGTVLSSSHSTTLQEFFEAGAAFSDTGQFVTVRSCTPAQGSKSEADYVVHNSVEWFAFIQR